MKVEQIYLNLDDIKPNPDNPRVITEVQLKKLTKSLKELPEMLDIRPLVVNEDNVLLGGNMRLRALTEIGIGESVLVTKISGFTPQQQTEFLIKDNLSYGEWDWQSVTTEYTDIDLSQWGLSIPSSFYDDDEEPEYDDIDFGQVDNSIKVITLKYLSDEYAEVVDMMTGLQLREDLTSFTEVVIFLLNEEN